MRPQSVLRTLLVVMVVYALILAQNLALIIVLGLVLTLGLALQERVRRLEEQPSVSAQTFSGTMVADGGSFTALTRDRERPTTKGVSVLDGGSLESSPFYY
jgi:hypothetical protein